jgi:hypothetical protein
MTNSLHGIQVNVTNPVVLVLITLLQFAPQQARLIGGIKLRFVRIEPLPRHDVTCLCIEGICFGVVRSVVLRSGYEVSTNP